MKNYSLLLLALLLLPVLNAPAQDRSLSRYKEYAYTGEWDTRNPDRQSLRIIKDGRIDFEYTLPIRDQWDRVLEFDDVRILPDGNILYAAMSQLGLLNRKTWSFSPSTARRARSSSGTPN